MTEIECKKMHMNISVILNDGVIHVVSMVAFFVRVKNGSGE